MIKHTMNVGGECFGRSNARLLFMIVRCSRVKYTMNFGEPLGGRMFEFF